MHANTIFFYNSTNDKPPPRFKGKSNWTLPPSDNPTIINFFTHIEQYLISANTLHTKTYSNLTPKENSAFDNLKNNQSIFIKPCDKGGGIAKIHTHLQDLDTYKPLTYNPANAIVNDTCTLIEYIHSKHIIDTATKKILLPSKNIRTPLFYGLPKIHKPGCPLCPIVSGCDAPTGHLSAYITHFIQPFASNLLSHIRDTKHFLNLIEQPPTLSPNALLVKADFMSLYTNIPH